ncbi:hypothetical protein [Nocardiopsis quinghaiensis]|uniref:hypothetical protein n=1 Tax=Nocardiopsis quinghaiensis TaxID=464995 RepID=UPI001CC25487|nr:hypothetical protein [Nocardiopsis quinghaiensis]
MAARDQVLPDRSLLLRTLAPIVGPISPDAVVRDVTASHVWGVDLYPAGSRATRTRSHVSVPRGVRTGGMPVAARHDPVPAADRTVVGRADHRTCAHRRRGRTRAHERNPPRLLDHRSD